MQALILGIGVVMAVAQAGASQFAGVWTAALDGKTYVRLELIDSGGTLSGRVGLGSFHVDKDGVVDQIIGPAGDFTPIFDVRVRDGVVSFARKDGDDIDRFELRLAGAAAQLAFVISAEEREAQTRLGVPLPKPVRLTRAPR